MTKKIQLASNYIIQPRDNVNAKFRKHEQITPFVINIPFDRINAKFWVIGAGTLVLVALTIWQAVNASLANVFLLQQKNANIQTVSHERFKKIPVKIASSQSVVNQPKKENTTAEYQTRPIEPIEEMDVEVMMNNINNVAYFDHLDMFQSNVGYKRQSELRDLVKQASLNYRLYALTKNEMNSLEQQRSATYVWMNRPLADNGNPFDSRTRINPYTHPKEMENHIERIISGLKPNYPKYENRTPYPKGTKQHKQWAEEQVDIYKNIQKQHDEARSKREQHYNKIVEVYKSIMEIAESAAMSSNKY